MKKVSPLRIHRRSMRGYTYSAYLRRGTGSLIKIKAGCRMWRTFEEAFAHYDPHAKRLSWQTPRRWSDDWMLSAIALNEDTLLNWLKHRVDARNTLRYLKDLCHHQQLKIRRMKASKC